MRAELNLHTDLDGGANCDADLNVWKAARLSVYFPEHRVNKASHFFMVL